MRNFGPSLIKPARWPLQPHLTAAPELWRDVFGVYPAWSPDADQLVDISGQGHTASQAAALSYTTGEYGLVYRTTDRIGLQALETDLDKYEVTLLTILNRVYVPGDQGFFDTRGSLRGLKSTLTNARRLTCQMGVDGPSGFASAGANIASNNEGEMPVVMRWWKGSDNYGYLDIKAANGDQGSAVTSSEIYDLQHKNDLFVDNIDENYETLRVIWNRRITDAERELVLRDPFAMLRPGPQAIPLLFGGAGATTGTPTTVSFANTSMSFITQPATVNAAVETDLTAASFAAGGEPITTLAGVTQTLEAAGLTAAAEPVNVLEGADIDLDSATFRTTAGDVTVNARFVADIAATAFGVQSEPVSLKLAPKITLDSARLLMSAQGLAGEGADKIRAGIVLLRRPP